MPIIRLLCIGKLKEPFYRDAQTEYVKRLSAFARVQVIEKKETPLPAGAPEALTARALRAPRAKRSSPPRGVR